MPNQHDANTLYIAADGPHIDLRRVAGGHTGRCEDCRLRARVRAFRPMKRATVRPLTTVIGILGVFSVFGPSTALAQEPVPAATPALTPMADTRVKQAHPVGVAEPSPVPKQFAFTFNPLNLLVGRFGFNFEYQPVLHHGLIVSPHYDHASGDPSYDAETTSFTDTLNGVGAELGYRFYSGHQGFDGFFAGPSLLIATHKLTRTNAASIPPGSETSVSFSSIGGAFDVGWQWQLGHFIVGGGAGVQYTKINESLPLSGRGVDLIMDWNAGGGWRPRLAFNLGYAF